VSIFAVFVSISSVFTQYSVNSDMLELSRVAIREQTANSTWERYVELSFQYPDLSSGTAAKSFVGDGREEDTRYTWFVERIMIAADQISYNMPHDEQWKDSLALEFRKHRKFVLSAYFLTGEGNIMPSYCTYRARARTWLRDAFRAEPASFARLQLAEANCQKIFKRRRWTEGLT
jgi:hypothetical protein